MFKETFKYYKTKTDSPDLTKVLHFKNDANSAAVREFKLAAEILPETRNPPGLQPVTSWHCYTFTEHPGLVLIRNPFTTQGQRYWIARCLRDYPRHPHAVNLHPNLFEPAVLEDWWKELHLCEDKMERRRIKTSMRWTTLGYHHDWNTKVYSDDMRSDFPDDLKQLCQYFAHQLNFTNFLSQAAIINYYPIGTTLAAHTDHSEKYLKAPLFSLSFGQNAIFLIGDETREKQPTALLLRSGDILVMSGPSRLCYHAVPRIMKADEELWNDLIPSQPALNFTESNTKKLRMEQEFTPSAANIDMLLFQQVLDEKFWAPYKSYLNDSRINVNVRQVLGPGKISLKSPDN